MIYFTKLFSKAPFDYLRLHMEKVTACMAKLGEIFAGLENYDATQIEALSNQVSEFEHEADIIKNNIRVAVPKSFLFPVDRTNFLEILALQDNIADSAEDLAGLLTIKQFEIIEEVREDLKCYFDKSVETVWEVKEIVENFNSLLESSFGGLPAEKTKSVIDQTSFKEREANQIKRTLIKKLFVRTEMLAPDFYLWMRMIEEIGMLSHYSEKLALRIGMLLDDK